MKHTNLNKWRKSISFALVISMLCGMFGGYLPAIKADAATTPATYTVTVENLGNDDTFFLCNETPSNGPVTLQYTLADSSSHGWDHNAYWTLIGSTAPDAVWWMPTAELGSGGMHNLIYLEAYSQQKYTLGLKEDFTLDVKEACAGTTEDASIMSDCTINSTTGSADTKFFGIMTTSSTAVRSFTLTNVTCVDAEGNDLGVQVKTSTSGTITVTKDVVEEEEEEPVAEPATYTVTVENLACGDTFFLCNEKPSDGPITLSYTLASSNTPGWDAGVYAYWHLMGTADPNTKWVSGTLADFGQHNLLNTGYATQEYTMELNSDGSLNPTVCVNGTEWDKMTSTGNAAEAKYFGIYTYGEAAWGTIDRTFTLTNVTCVDAEGNDLGVQVNTYEGRQGNVEVKKDVQIRDVIMIDPDNIQPGGYYVFAAQSMDCQYGGAVCVHNHPAGYWNFAMSSEGNDYTTGDVANDRYVLDHVLYNGSVEQTTETVIWQCQEYEEGYSFRAFSGEGENSYLRITDAETKTLGLGAEQAWTISPTNSPEKIDLKNGTDYINFTTAHGGGFDTSEWSHSFLVYQVIFSDTDLGPDEPEDHSDALYTIAAVSDMHIGYGDDNEDATDGYNAFYQMREETKAALEVLKETENPDMLITGGDMIGYDGLHTWNKEQYDAAISEMKTNLSNATGTGEVLYVNGNHDFEPGYFATEGTDFFNAGAYIDTNLIEEENKFYEEVTVGNATENYLMAYYYKKQVADGVNVHYVGLSTPMQENTVAEYTVDSVNWVIEKLATIPENEFIIMTGHYRQQAANNDNGAIATLQNALVKYPNLIFLYGHEHGSYIIESDTYEQVMSYNADGTIEKNRAKRGSGYTASFMGSLSYHGNRYSPTWLNAEPISVIQILMIYVYEDHVVLQTKNYGEKTGLLQNPASYTINKAKKAVTLQEMGIHTGVYVGNGAYNVPAEGQYTAADTLFNTKMTTKLTISKDVHCGLLYAGKESAWQGIKIFAGGDDNLYIGAENGEFAEGFTLEADKVEGVSSLTDTEIELSLELLQNGSDAELGVYINGVLYNNEYFTLTGAADKLGNYVGLRMIDGSVRVGATPKEVTLSEMGIADGKYADTVNDGNLQYIANGTYSSATSLLDTKMTTKITFMNIHSRLFYAGSWSHGGIQIWNTGGTELTVQAAGSEFPETFGLNLDNISLTNRQIELSIELLRSGADARIGFYINGQLYNNQYYTLIGAAATLGNCVGIAGLGSYVRIGELAEDYYNLETGAYLVSGNGTLTVDDEVTVSGTELTTPGMYTIINAGQDAYEKKIGLYYRGDAHQDGKLDIKDLVSIKKIVAGQTVVDTELLKKSANADTENDEINGEDVKEIRRCLISESVTGKK